MRLQLIQKNTNNPDYLDFLKPDSLKNSDLICFGELAVSGCLYNGGEGYQLDEILAGLKDTAPAVMLGFPNRREGEIYNSYIFHDRGEFEIYDKINLAISQISTEGNYDFIFNSAALAFAKPEFDITDKVLELLEEE